MSPVSPTLLRQLHGQRSGSRTVFHDRLLQDNPSFSIEERATVGLRNLVQGTEQAEAIAVKILWDCRRSLALVGPCGPLSQRLVREWLEPEPVWRAKVERWAFWLDAEGDIDLDEAAERRALDAELELVTRLTRAEAAPGETEIAELKHAVRRFSYKPFVDQAMTALISFGEEPACLQTLDWLSAAELDAIVREASTGPYPPVSRGQLKQALMQIDFVSVDEPDISLENAVRGPFGANLIAQFFPDTIALIDRIIREGTSPSWGWRKRDLQRFAAECRRQRRALTS